MHRYGFAPLLMMVAVPSFALTVREASDLVASGQTRLDLLVVKFGDAEEIIQSSKQEVRLANGRNFVLNSSSSVEFEPMLWDSKRLKEDRARREQLRRKSLPRLENYYYAWLDPALSQAEATKLLSDLYSDLDVEFANFEPLYQNASLSRSENTTNPSPNGAVPDFEPLQFQLDPAPRGVDARYAWDFPGGEGAGIRVIDVELGWNDNHVEFEPLFFANGINSRDHHGTAVWGEIGARRDGMGTTGVSPSVEFGISGAVWQGDWIRWRMTLVRAIADADPNLNPGDVLVIEQQAPGPDSGRVAPPEYYQDVFDVVQAITDRGVLCVAAAGNGSSNLDDPSYMGAFDLETRDSGCIIVGAGGAPETPEHLQRLSFSNYGSRIDAFAYGEHVVTTGYGDLYSSGGTNYYYTRSFSGTSSATPIVAGAVCALSGIAKAEGSTLTTSELRQALRTTGTPQQGDLTTPIGTLPNLPELIEALAL